jgi:hypothetical protein
MGDGGLGEGSEISEHINDARHFLRQGAIDHWDLFLEQTAQLPQFLVLEHTQHSVCAPRFQAEDRFGHVSKRRKRPYQDARVRIGVTQSAGQKPVLPNRPRG